MLSSSVKDRIGRWTCFTPFEAFKIKCYSKANVKSNSSSTVERVHINEQSLNYFPSGLEKFFPRVRSLSINNCMLQSLSRHQLVGLEELEHLAVNSNLLRSLPSDLFIGMTRLKSISFKDNKLENISSNLLTPIFKNKPTLIDFRRNFKIDAVYDASMSRTGISLKRLMDLIDANCDKPAGEQVHVSTIDSFKEDLASGFADLWESSDHSDFTIIAKGQKKFRVHKNVLSIQIPVFAAMFKHNMEEKRTGTLTILDFSAESVEQFIASLSNSLLAFTKLKKASEHNVLENIDNINAYDVFALGHRCHLLCNARPSMSLSKLCQSWRTIC